MAQLGFVNFVAGNVLSEAQIDGIMRQTTMCFASTAARDSALSGTLEEGMFAYTNDANSVWFYDGAEWVPFSTPWTSYTPTWSNLTVGNGTQVGRYRYVNGSISFRGSLTFGTTTSVTGSFTGVIPNSETADAIESVGTISVSDTGTANYVGVGYCNGTTGWTCRFNGSGNSGLMNATNPMTWTTSDVIRWQFNDVGIA
jgi:hypothetical protein